MFLNFEKILHFWFPNIPLPWRHKSLYFSKHFFSFGHFIGNLYWLSMVTGDPGPERLTFQLAMLKSLTLSKSFPVGTMHIFLERPIGGEMLVYSINFFKKFFAKWEVWYLEWVFVWNSENLGFVTEKNHLEPVTKMFYARVCYFLKWRCRLFQRAAVKQLLTTPGSWMCFTERVIPSSSSDHSEDPNLGVLSWVWLLKYLWVRAIPIL